MPEDTFIDDLGFIVVGGAVFAFVARRVGMPSIVAYLLAGLFLGPVTGLVTLSDSLGLLSETGIALLLFLVGLELSFGKIRDVGRVAVVAGIGQMSLFGILGLALGRLFGFSWIEAGFLAAGLTFSSTVVSVKLLEEKGELGSLHGRIAVGILLMQDLAAILILTILAGLGERTAGGSDLDLGAAVRSLGLAFGGMLVLLAAALLASRYLLPRPFAWAARRPDTLLIWSLSWCFAMVMGAHAMHLSVEVGAFLAGISLAQLPYNEELQRRVHPLLNFCIAIFFVSLGARMNPAAAMGSWHVVVLLSLIVVFLKPPVFAWLVGRLGFPRKSAFLTGVTLAQISEFSFIVVALGISKGLIGEQVMSQFALIGLITITASAYLIRFSGPIYDSVGRRGRLLHFLSGGGHRTDGRGSAPEGTEADEDLSGHVIVVGMNSLGRGLAKALHRCGRTVVAVDTDPMKLGGLPCRTVLGNAAHRDVLEHLGYRRAGLLVSALRIDAANDLIAYRCREAGVPCAIHVHDQREMDQLVEIGTDYLMISKVDGVKRLNAMLREMGYLPAKRA